MTEWEICELFGAAKVRKVLLERITHRRKEKTVVIVSVVTDTEPPMDGVTVCRIAVSVKTKENFELVLKSKNHYDEQSQTQLSPGIYEMYSDTELIQSEFMDFQTHLYKYGEMEEYLKEVGFTQVKTYSSFDKEIAINDRCEMFLFECEL